MFVVIKGEVQIGFVASCQGGGGAEVEKFKVT